MATIIKNALSDQDVATLLEYFYMPDEDLDSRPDVTSKSPDPNNTHWPGHILTQCLDRILENPYAIEEVLFLKTTSWYQVHTDSALGSDQQRLGNAVLFPLLTPGPCGTVFFDNYWSGPSTKFTKSPVRKWQYDLPNRHGSTTYVPDMRKLKQQIVQDPGSVTDFETTTDFVATLDRLIALRDDNSQYNARRSVKRHQWISDYSGVSNLNDCAFPEEIRSQYCRHLPPADLQGLTFERYTPWSPGDAIVFDRRQLHCTGTGTPGKIGVTVFTNLA